MLRCFDEGTGTISVETGDHVEVSGQARQEGGGRSYSSFPYSNFLKQDLYSAVLDQTCDDGSSWKLGQTTFLAA